MHRSKGISTQDGEIFLQIRPLNPGKCNTSRFAFPVWEPLSRVKPQRGQNLRATTSNMWHEGSKLLFMYVKPGY